MIQRSKIQSLRKTQKRKARIFSFRFNCHSTFAAVAYKTFAFELEIPSVHKNAEQTAPLPPKNIFKVFFLAKVLSLLVYYRCAARSSSSIFHAF